MIKKIKHLAAVGVLFFTVTVCGCATVPRQPPITIGREVYLKDVCEKNGIFWQWDQVSQVVTLKYRGAQAKVLIGSELVLIGEERITLSAPARIIQSAVIVPADFKTKVIGPLRTESRKRQVHIIPKIRSIVVDAGHGGKDPGAIGRTGTKEKDVVLDIVKRLKKHLQRDGFEVKLTRNGDTFLSLKERTEIASRGQYDLFISVHANSSPARSVYGLESYSEKELSFADRVEEQRKRNEYLYFMNTSIKRTDSNVKRIVSDMLYENKRAEAEAMSKAIGERMAKLLKTKNRGDKKERFFVLRNTLIPAVLVEVGFLSNPKEENLLKTGSYREKIAKSLAKSITEYANGAR